MEGRALITRGGMHSATLKLDLCAAKRFAQVEMIKILYFSFIGYGVVSHKNSNYYVKTTRTKTTTYSLYFDMAEVNLDI